MFWAALNYLGFPTRSQLSLQLRSLLSVMRCLLSLQGYTRVMQKVLSLTGLPGFIPGIFINASLHLNGVLNS